MQHGLATVPSSTFLRISYPRSRGSRASGIRPGIHAGYPGVIGLPKPRSRGFTCAALAFESARLNPNREKPRERGYSNGGEQLRPPAVNGGPTTATAESPVNGALSPAYLPCYFTTFPSPQSVGQNRAAPFRHRPSPVARPSGWALARLEFSNCDMKKQLITGVSHVGLTSSRV